MAIASRTQLSHLLAAFEGQQLPISEFLVALLKHRDFTEHPSVHHLLTHTDDVLEAFLAHPRSSKPVLHMADIRGAGWPLRGSDQKSTWEGRQEQEASGFDVWRAKTRERELVSVHCQDVREVEELAKAPMANNRAGGPADSVASGALV
ncbi:hypothetical protein DFH09DRAFT_1270729 [Mycena vulgaris]|nr:hypothetical protein DFH09DRAFT_1270729 [Mycena vulgaris]